MRALWLAFFWVALACSAPPAPPPAPPPTPNANAKPSASVIASAPPVAPLPSAPAVPKGPFNVLLIVVDSLRADMPWLGYSRGIAPNLTALAKTCTNYSRSYSTSSYTAKSVAALLSGKYPSQLKRSGYFFAKYPSSNTFFPELLSEAGVHTMATHGHMYLKPGNTGMDQGFLDWRIVSGITFDAQTDNHVTSDKITPLALEQIAKVPEGKRFFHYLHYVDPHDKYLRHKESPDFGRKNRDKYDSEVWFTDMWIGKLLDALREKPFWNDTVVIVTADHGEAFGEHNQYRHAFELWDTLTHVPLLICGPGIKARKLDTPRGSVDLAPTILELMGVTGDPGFVGKSLVSELRGGAAEARPVLLDLPADSNNPERRAYIDGKLKLLVFGNDWRFDLYDLENDPGETKNLAKTDPSELSRMKAAYQKLWGPLVKVKPYGGNALEGGGTASGPEN